MSLTITNKLIIKEAEKYGVNHTIISENHDLILLEYNGNKKIIRRSRIANTSGVFSYIADNKDATYSLMDFFGYSYPESIICKNESDIQNAINKLKYPLVIKPIDGAHGDGVTTNLANLNDCKKAFLYAEKINSGDIIIQKHFKGYDFRIMVVGYKTIAVTKRIPARIFGDGILSIKELIDKENKNPLRGDGHSTALTKISIDDEIIQVLENQKKELSTIPNKNEEIQLRRIGNLSKGGEAEDITEKIPPENLKLFENIAKDLGAEVVGIDILSENPTKILKKEDYSVIEVNVSPGIRMHHFPSKGKSHNVALAILKTLFPEIKK